MRPYVEFTFTLYHPVRCRIASRHSDREPRLSSHATLALLPLAAAGSKVCGAAGLPAALSTISWKVRWKSLEPNRKFMNNRSDKDLDISERLLLRCVTGWAQL